MIWENVSPASYIWSHVGYLAVSFLWIRFGKGYRVPFHDRDSVEKWEEISNNSYFFQT